MKKLSQFLLFILFASSCQFSSEPAFTNEESISSENAGFPWTKEIPKPEFTCPDKEVELDITKDQACDEKDSCVVIDRGCCPGEKRVAVNWKSLNSIKRKLRQGCADLLAEEAKKKNHDICRSRKHLGLFFSESPQCINKKCVISAKKPACLESKCVMSESSCCQERKCVEAEPATK